MIHICTISLDHVDAFYDTSKVNLYVINSIHIFLCLEPDFVAAYEIEDFLYFFLRESALEHNTCGKSIYSRVARICKVIVPNLKKYTIL